MIIQSVTHDHTESLNQHCWPDASRENVYALLANIIRRRERDLAWAVVAEVDDEAVGYGQLARWGSKAEISDLIVSPDYRGQGIGTALIKALLELAADETIDVVEIGAQESNLTALRLYRELGFKTCRRIQMDFGRGPEPVLYLSVTLNDLPYAVSQPIDITHPG